MGSSVPLDEAIAQTGINNFKKHILETFESRKDAESHEVAIHLEYDVASNPEFYNKKNGILGFHTTPESTRKSIDTKSDPIWKEKVGKVAAAKISAIRLNSAWKATTGNKSIIKYKETIHESNWKETVGATKIQKYKETIGHAAWKDGAGKEQSRKMKEIKSDPIWKETVGKDKIQKYKETIGDPTWQETTGKEKAKKISKQRLDPVWIKANTFICPHCKRSINGKAMLNRWHNDNCRYKSDSAK